MCVTNKIHISFKNQVKSNQKHPRCKKGAAKNWNRPCWKRYEVKWVVKPSCSFQYYINKLVQSAFHMSTSLFGFLLHHNSQNLIPKQNGYQRQQSFSYHPVISFCVMLQHQEHWDRSHLNPTALVDYHWCNTHSWLHLRLINDSNNLIVRCK